MRFTVVARASGARVSPLIPGCVSAPVGQSCVWQTRGLEACRVETGLERVGVQMVAICDWKGSWGHGAEPRGLPLGTSSLMGFQGAGWHPGPEGVAGWELRYMRARGLAVAVCTHPQHGYRV